MTPTDFLQVADNAVASTATDYTSTGVTATALASGKGTLFPAPGNGFIVTIWTGVANSDPGADPHMEKVLVTARSTDTLTHSATTKTHAAPVRVAALDVIEITEEMQDAINALETTRALDSAVVHKTGAETLAGVKTFSSAPVVPSGAFPESAVSGLAADLALLALDSAVVHKATTETITGLKTFSNGLYSQLESRISNGAWTDPHGGNAYDAKFGGAGNGIAVAGPSKFNSAVTFPAGGVAQAAVASLVADLAARAQLTGDLGGVGSTGALPVLKNVVRHFNIKDYGAKCDYAHITDGVMTAASGILTSASNPFTALDVAKKVVVPGAGAAGVPLLTTIASYQGAGQVTLTVAASTTVSGAAANWATDDSTAINAAFAAAENVAGAAVYLPGIAGVAAQTGSALSDRYPNVMVCGYSRELSGLVAFGSVAMINFGNGNAALGKTWSGYQFSDFFIDMNNLPLSGLYGMTLGCGKDIRIDNMHFKNAANGAKAFLFWGASTGATSAMISRNLTVTNTIFSDSTAGWEGITLAQGLGAKFIGCEFRNKTVGYMFLNYGSHNVTVVGCDFESCNNGLNGHGAFTAVGCTLYNAHFNVQADNSLFMGCTIDGDSTYTGARGISYLGYAQAGSEAFWDAPAPDSDVRLRNNRIKGLTIKYANSTAIGAGWFTSLLGGNVLSCIDLNIDDVTIEKSYWQGADIKADYLTVENSKSYNNGQLGTASVKFNWVLGALEGTFRNNRSYDDQGVPTATRDFFIDNQLVADALPTQNWQMDDNKFGIGSVPYYYSGGSFTSTKPSNITLRGRNNKLINPTATYSLGTSLSGAVTINRVNGSVQTGTLTGNITPTLTAGLMLDDEITMVLTQDGTGSRTWTKPSNLKVAGGTITLSTAAGAIDIIKARWDGTNWIANPPQLNVS